MGNRRDYLTSQIVDICQRLDRKGYVANHDGNVSVKFDGKFLATPTAEAKGKINETMIILLNEKGEKIEGIGGVFSEIKLHLAAYKARPDAVCVVHAHPPFSTARGLVGNALTPALPEAIISIGANIPVVPFAMPGDKINDQLISDAFKISDVVMMAGNGVLSIGDDLEQAYLRIELLEHIAQIDYYSKTMGYPMTLSDSDMTKLLEKRKSINLGPEARLGLTNTKSETVSNPVKESDPLRDMIKLELKKLLSEG